MVVLLQRRGNGCDGRCMLSVATVWLVAVAGLLLSSISIHDDRALVASFSVFSPTTHVAPNTRFGATASSVKIFQQASSPRRGPPSSVRRRKTVLYRIRCENKYYQLEEMEDRETCTTELFLKEDGQILIGETDGPLWTEAVGKLHSLVVEYLCLSERINVCADF
jgi:hypothetical protein